MRIRTDGGGNKGDGEIQNGACKGIRKMYAANLRYLKEDDFGVERDLEQTNEFLIQERSVYLPREKREN